jgi:hypothetical protein
MFERPIKAESGSGIACGGSLACLLAVSKAPLDVRENTSIAPKATHFRVESAKMRCGKGHGFPRAARRRIRVVQVPARIPLFRLVDQI